MTDEEFDFSAFGQQKVKPAEVWEYKNEITKATINNSTAVAFAAAQAIEDHSLDEMIDPLERLMYYMRLNSQAVKEGMGKSGRASEAYKDVATAMKRIDDLKEIRSKKQDEEI